MFVYLITQNKHIKFNKGEYIGHLTPAIEDSMTDDTTYPRSAKYSLNK